MLDADRIRRMIHANTIEDTTKILFEMDYDLSEDDIINPSDAIITNELKRFVKEFGELCPSDDLLYVVLGRFYYHNAAAFYNARLRNPDDAKASSTVDSVYPFGNDYLEPVMLRSAIYRKSYINLPDAMALTLRKLDDIASPSPFMVDLEFNRALYADIFTKLKPIKNRHIKQYFRAEIDLLNLRTYAKLRFAGNIPSDIYIEGGEISEESLNTIFEKNLRNSKVAFMGLNYDAVIAELMIGLENANLVRFENTSNNFLIELSKEGSDDIFSLSMLFGWFIAKMEELRIVKTILIGKKFGKSRDELREDLRGIIEFGG